MSESNFLAMTGLATQALFAALLAVLLGRFFRRHRRPYLREWSRAWWAFSLAQLGALYGLAQQAELPAAHWSRLLSSSLSLVGAYWHAAWLLFGVYAIASRRGVSRRGGRAILAALALLGVVSALLWAFAPGAAAERMLVRVGVRSLVLAFALLAAAVALWRAYRAAPETGPRFVALAFGLWGLQQLLLFGLAAGLVRLAFVSALGYLDVALIAFLGLATVVWLLEEEHHRLTDASRQIERLAYFDMLTGLPNRKLFLDRLRAWTEREADGGQAAALFFLDLDHFKRINDTWGHAVGDRALAAVAAVLTAPSRGRDLCARFGGEEFVLLFEETDGETALEIAERLRRRVEALELEEDGRRLELTMSFGVAAFPELHVRSGHELVELADAALYTAKHLGRNLCLLDTGGGRLKTAAGEWVEVAEPPEPRAPVFFA